jgi:hypothetical protein
MKAEPTEWKLSGWEEHGKLRREISREMTFVERLHWLENATRSGRLLRDAPTVAAPEFARRKAPVS